MISILTGPVPLFFWLIFSVTVLILIEIKIKKYKKLLDRFEKLGENCDFFLRFFDILKEKGCVVVEAHSHGHKTSGGNDD